jgi:hypothetical protein
MIEPLCKLVPRLFRARQFQGRKRTFPFREKNIGVLYYVWKKWKYISVDSERTQKKKKKHYSRNEPEDKWQNMRFAFCYFFSLYFYVKCYF